MSMRLLDLAPRPDLPLLQAEYARRQRLQIPDVLTADSAAILHRILARETPWGLLWKAGQGGVRHHRSDEIRDMTPAQHEARMAQLGHAMRGNDYGFAYAGYPMVEAYQKRWSPDGPHDMLLEYLNDRPMMDMVRAVTGMPDLVKADAQATLYAPGHFLAVHDDQEADAGRRVAYVLSLCAGEWRPDWGGYLQFYDERGDVTAGFRPRFNVLNLFTVPQPHNVTAVTPHAPIGRFAITGWFRDR